MSANLVLLVLMLLAIKHFIVDFPLQAYPYQYNNKGTYGHPGGLLHSGLHGIGTLIALSVVIAPITALMYAAIDAVVHYHIDWAKMNINKKTGWGPTTHEEFWTLLGLDQLLHTLTYLWIVWMIV
jgi:Protein of unknown function (DUF3307)